MIITLKWICILKKSMHQENKALDFKGKTNAPPDPSRYDEDGSASEFWYEGRHTGRWYLTNEGILLLRKAVRSEKKESHEALAIWTKWLIPAATLIAIITGVIKLIK